MFHSDIPESELLPKPRKLSKHPNSTSPILTALEECIEEMKSPQERFESYLQKVIQATATESVPSQDQEE